MARHVATLIQVFASRSSFEPQVQFFSVNNTTPGGCGVWYSLHDPSTPLEASYSPHSERQHSSDDTGNIDCNSIPTVFGAPISASVDKINYLLIHQISTFQLETGDGLTSREGVTSTSSLLLMTNQSSLQSINQAV